MTQIRADGSGKVNSAAPGDAFGLPVDAKHFLGRRVILVEPGRAAVLYQGIKVACWHAKGVVAEPLALEKQPAQ